MKAGHRKELQTNLLADRMGRLVQGMRSGPKGTSPIVWVIAVVAVVTLGAWYFASSNRGSQSAAWLMLDRFSTLDRAGSGSDAALRDIARIYPGTIAARTARFQRARLLLRQGLESIYGFARQTAADNLQEARELFSDLAGECSGDPILEPEAVLGQAKAEEALAGVPKPDPNASESRGDLNKALKLYQRLAKAYPESFEGQQAAKYAQQLQENRDRIEQFYADLRKQGSSKAP
jgi:hypothetical protein